MRETARVTTVLVALASILGAVSAVPRHAVARPQGGKAKIVAQDLVEEMLSKHPEADEIGISALSSHGRRTIASTDRGDIGEPAYARARLGLRLSGPELSKGPCASRKSALGRAEVPKNLEKEPRLHGARQMTLPSLPKRTSEAAEVV